MPRTAAPSTVSSKRSHAAISTSHTDTSSLSLSGLAPLSPPSSPASPPPRPPFLRPASQLRAARAALPYLYDFFYDFSMDWPFYAMCWAPLLPPTSASFTALSSSDRRDYVMQRLYYAQATDASFDPYWGRFVGNPHTLVQAEMPLPSMPCVADMHAAATGDPVILEDVTCSYVTDQRKLAHPGEINRIKLCHQRDDVVLTHTDSPRVYLWDFARQPPKAVKVNCRPSVPDLQLLGHQEDAEQPHPLYFALDTAQSEARVISGGPDRNVCLWALGDFGSTLASAEPVGGTDGVQRPTAASLLQARSVYVGHSACVEDVCFHPQSAVQFASVGDDRLLFLWDERIDGGVAARMQTGHADDVNAVSWNPINEHLLLTASSDQLVHLVDLRRRSSSAGAADVGVLHVFAGHEREVKNVGWAPDGLHFASAGDDADVLVWNIQHLPHPPTDAAKASRVQSSYYRALPSYDPCLVFRHATHPSAVQFFQWNPYHAPGLTVASIHGDTGGQMQFWRINERLHGDLEQRNGEVRHWRRQQKKEQKDAHRESKEELERGDGGGGPPHNSKAAVTGSNHQPLPPLTKR